MLQLVEVRKAYKTGDFTLKSGATMQGPATIIEDETTIIVPSSRMAVRQPDGCIDVTVKKEA